MANIVVLPFMLLLFCIGIAIPVWIGFYVYKDAKKRNMDAVVWTIVAVVVPSLIGFIIYIIVRPNLNMKCPSCSKVINDEFSICPYCGQKLKANCPQCQTPLSHGWTHCPTCGKETSMEQFELIPSPVPIKRDKTLTAVLIGVIIIPLVLFLIAIIAFMNFRFASFDKVVKESSVVIEQYE